MSGPKRAQSARRARALALLKKKIQKKILMSKAPTRHSSRLPATAQQSSTTKVVHVRKVH